MALTVRAVNNVPGVWLEAAVWGGERSEGGAALSGSLSPPPLSYNIYPGMGVRCSDLRGHPVK